MRKLTLKNFLERVEFGPGCWMWVGPQTDRYGGWGRHGYAHRYAYETFRGAIDEGLYVLHRCDIPLCVRPSHLFLGTQAENLEDARQKGRLPQYKKGA